MPSPAFDISIREDYHRSEVVIFEKILRHGETLRLYIPQEKADRLPDFLDVDPVDLEEEVAEAAPDPPPPPARTPPPADPPPSEPEE